MDRLAVLPVEVLVVAVLEVVVVVVVDDVATGSSAAISLEK